MDPLEKLIWLGLILCLSIMVVLMAVSITLEGS